MRIAGQGTVPADGFSFLRSKGPDAAVADKEAFVRTESSPARNCLRVRSYRSNGKVLSVTTRSARRMLLAVSMTDATSSDEGAVVADGLRADGGGTAAAAAAAAAAFVAARIV
jgi:hypothetical protein